MSESQRRVEELERHMGSLPSYIFDEEPQPERRVTRAPRRQPHLYFVQCNPDGPIKIGIAQDVAARVRSMQSGCPFPLRLLAVIERGWEMERALHKQFAAHRFSGEWFHPVPELLALVERAAALAFGRGPQEEPHAQQREHDAHRHAGPEQHHCRPYIA